MCETAWSLGLGVRGVTASPLTRTRESAQPWLDAFHLPLQIDVNEWWSLDEALESIPQLVELGVAYVEQPLPAGDAGAEELRSASPIPIYVDEDCHTLADISACAERAHGDRALHEEARAREEEKEVAGAQRPRRPVGAPA